MALIKVDFNKKEGLIKPVHAVGQPPILGWCSDSMFHYLTEAGMPYSRLHDPGSGFGGARFVDIPNVFPDFNADPDDPASYDFTFTDALITGLVKANVEPYYRLGITIENEVKRKAYHVFPPKDFLKWARICAGVIRHYTKGWANGFEYKITYWEIWNEPEGYPDRICMWAGTWEQYMELYEISSKYLKEQFPEIKVGGYASCGFYRITNPESTNPMYDLFMDCFEKFLAFVKERKCPLDFFSWHSYSDPDKMQQAAFFVDKKLKEYGFSGVESHLNEWNPGPRNRDSAEHAAATAAGILAMQQSPTDIGMFYDARCAISSYGGLFNPMNFRPLKSYWGFFAFNELYRRKNAVYASSNSGNVWVQAAADEKGGSVMIVNNTAQNQALDLDLGGKKITDCHITDAVRNHVPSSLPVTLQPHSILLLTVK